MKVQHIVMGSVLLLLTACHHLKGDEILPRGEENIADAINAGGQQGLSNMEDLGRKRTSQTREQQ
ncbi:MAG: hypothetical protein NTAFB01_17960 [Nitrospira sp.]